jgi:hypothetical protein
MTYRLVFRVGTVGSYQYQTFPFPTLFAARQAGARREDWVIEDCHGPVEYLIR